MLQKLRGNNKGFTLIELMIVIAIIGILAAIAIPNFISYRNKSYCSDAESNGNAIAGALSNYFSIASRTGLPGSAAGVDLTISNTNSIGGSPNTTITITVTDASGRCPTEYQAGSDYWSGNVFTKYMR